MMSRRRKDFLIGLALAGCLAAIPLFDSEDFFLSSLEYVLAFVMVAVGFNIVTGYAGQLSLGPGAIFAIGAWAAAIFAQQFSSAAGLASMSAVALLATVVAGLVIGIPSLRVGGFYLAMVTLLVALVVPVVANNLSITGGDRGIALFGVANFQPQWSGPALYEIGVIIIVVIAWLSWLLLHSRVGTQFALVSAGDQLASSLGVPVYRSKLTAFVLSSMPAGLGGAFYVYSQQFMSPQSAPPELSIFLLAACVIGGLGTVFGPIVGGFLVIAFTQFLGPFQQYDGIVLGFLLALFALLLPNGIFGLNWGVGRSVLASIGRSLLEGVGQRRATRPAKAQPSLYPAGGVGEEATASLPTERSPVDGPSLVVTAAGKRFAGVVAVLNLDLTVRPGAVHGLIGSNGSGKTTLLNLVSGFYELDHGEIRVGDQLLSGLQPRHVASLGISRTFQTPKLVDHLTLLENVSAAAHQAHRCSGVSSVLRLPRGRRADRAAIELAHRCLVAVGQGGREQEKAGEQSHGVRRLVEIARAMAMVPRFLLLDEPAAGLAPDELRLLGKVIRKLKTEGLGVLLVEHNVPFVLELASEVTVLHEGQRLAVGSPRELRDNVDVRRSFLGAML